jgi:hypothetical protein
MYLSDFVRIMLRRWYVTLPLAALVAVAGAWAWTTAPAEYRSTGSVVLLSPSVEDGDAINPFLAQTGGLYVMAASTAQLMADPVVEESLRQLGATGKYTIGTNPGILTPNVDIVATGDSPVEAIRTIQVISQQIDVEWELQQESLGAPQETLISAHILTSPTPPELQVGSKVKPTVAVLAAGAIVVIGAGLLVDAWAKARARRRDVARVSQVAEDTDSGVDSPPLRSIAAVAPLRSRNGAGAGDDVDDERGHDTEPSVRQATLILRRREGG